MMHPRLVEAIRGSNRNGIEEVAAESPNLLLRASTPEGNTSLHIAVGFGPLESVKKICDICGSALLARCNAKGQTPLHLAATTGDLDVAKILMSKLAAPADVEHGGEEAVTELLRIADANGDTALHVALRNKHREVAALLLERDDGGLGLCDLVNKAGESPLYLAALRGDLKILKRMLDFGSISHEGPEGRNALHAAAAIQEDIECAKELLEKRPGIEILADNNGQIPLHHAAHWRRPEMVKLLLKHDSSTAYYKDKDGNMPIHIAARFDFVNVFEILYAWCPDSAYAVNNSGENVLHISTRITSRFANMTKFIGAKAELRRLINHRDNNGNTPLHLAVLQNTFQFGLHQFLKSTEADPWVTDHHGNTALDLLYSRVDQLPSHAMACFSTLFKDCWTKEDMEKSHSWAFDVERRNKEEQQLFTVFDKYGSNVSLVATLMATITFAAAFAMPGGYSIYKGDEEGKAVLSRNAAFRVFLISDTISMCCSLMVAYLFSSTKITHSLEIFLLTYSNFAGWLMRVSFVGMLVAFASGIYAVVAPDSTWIGILICLVCAILPFISYAIDHSFYFGYWIIRMLMDNEKLRSTSQTTK